MTPFLMRDAGAPAGSPASQVPPLSFKEVQHPISHATIRTIGYTRSSGLTDAQERGLRYEAKVQQYLLEQFPTYLAGPWFTFTDNSGQRICQPDGLLCYQDRAFIFEIKFQHCPEAWWQLEKLYKQVVGKVCHCPISLVEICRSYDPATPFPCPVELVSDLEEWITVPQEKFGVFQWRK